VTQIVERIGGGIYKTAKGVANLAGLENKAWGRKTIAFLNMIGAKTFRLLVMNRRPFQINGHLMYLGGKVAPSISFSADMLAGKYEPEITVMMEQVLRPGMRAIDVGAHIGFHVLLAARLVGPTGRVYAFEPARDNFDVLQRNIALNSYKNVTAVNKAVTDTSGTVTFHLSPEGNDRHSIRNSSRNAISHESVTVGTVSIDDFLESENWPAIDVIKMDAEGAEPNVFRGMRKLVLRATRLHMFIEFAPSCLEESGFDPREFLSEIMSSGFEIRLLGGAQNESLDPLRPEDFSRFIEEAKREGMKNLFCSK